MNRGLKIIELPVKIAAAAVPTRRLLPANLGPMHERSHIWPAIAFPMHLRFDSWVREASPAEKA